MTTTMDVRDLAKRRHVLRIRIYNDERELAIAYPDKAGQLERNLEAKRAQLAELDAHLEAAKEQVRDELRSALDAYFDTRDVLLKLNGYFQDPGFCDSIFVRPYLSRGPLMPVGTDRETTGDPQETFEVKEALLRVADMKPAQEPQVSETQRLHEESLRNERAGRGYATDDYLQRLATEDPIQVIHGRGARVIPMLNQGGDDDA